MRRKHYLGGVLTDEESKEFLATYNKKAERECLVCGGKFVSPGSHVHVCNKVKCQKVLENDDMNIEYKVEQSGSVYRGEID